MDGKTLNIRLVKDEDLAEMQELFVGAIKAVCAKDYNEDEIRVWTKSVENKMRWLTKMKEQYFLIAELDQKIVGYASLDKGNYFDFLYVHKDFQGQGIAQRLLKEIELEAVRSSTKQIESDVSITAKSFFERNGYVVQKTNTTIIDEIEISNYKMTKRV